MTFQRRISRTGDKMVKRALSVQAALEWAFRVERAQPELPPPQRVTEDGFGFGLEYVLLQRAARGCKVDGGRLKTENYSHPDAEEIADTIAGMPDSLGGIHMAIRVVELARTGLTPDWMPGEGVAEGGNLTDAVASLPLRHHAEAAILVGGWSREHGPVRRPRKRPSGKAVCFVDMTKVPTGPSYASTNCRSRHDTPRSVEPADEN